MKKIYNKRFYKSDFALLSKKARNARQYVFRICNLLTKLSGRQFTAYVHAYNNSYEGQIFDSGNYIEKDEDEFILSDVGDPIAMIFWGGYYSRKKNKDAKSKAWISLLEDCIGTTDICNIHNLTDHLKQFGPKIDLNCKTIEKLEEILKSYDC